MPIDFASIANRFRTPVRLQMFTITAVLVSLQRWLARQARQVGEAERATRGLPILMFRDEALSATIADFQREALQAGPGVFESLSQSGAAFLDGLGDARRLAADANILPAFFTSASGIMQILDESTQRVYAGIAADVRPENALFDPRRRTASDVFGEALLGGVALATSVPQILATGPAVTQLAAAVRTVRPGAGDAEEQAPSGSRLDVASLTLSGIPLALARELPGPAGLSVYLVAALLLLPRLPVLISGILGELDLALRAAVLTQFQRIERAVLTLRGQVIDLLTDSLHRSLRAALGYGSALQLVLTVNVQILFLWLRQFGIPFLERIGDYLTKLGRFIDWAARALQWLVNAIGFVFGALLRVLTLRGGSGPAMPAETGLPAAAMIPPFPDLFTDAIAPGLPDLEETLRRLRGGATEGLTLVAGAAQSALRDLSTLSDAELDRAARIGPRAPFAETGQGAVELADLAIGAEARTARERAAARTRTAFERWLTSGGFTIIGDALPLYITEMDRWWRAERERLPTSPHVLRRSMRLGRVVTPRLTVHAIGRGLDDALIQTLAAHVRAAVQDAYLQGQAVVAAAAE